MTSSSETPEIELVRRCFDAWSDGDFARLAHRLAKDARWLAAAEGVAPCEGREQIIEVMSRNAAGDRARGEIETMAQHGSRVLVAFRPTTPADLQNRPLENGLGYMVVTISAGRITELKGCADRVAALEYARTD